jgi:hypothetical protein
MEEIKTGFISWKSKIESPLDSLEEGFAVVLGVSYHYLSLQFGIRESPNRGGERKAHLLY